MAAPQATPAGTTLPATPNIVFVLLDDMGNDRASFATPPGTDPPVTPMLDMLAAQGATFDRFWTMPSCKPTRASVMTGLLPRDTGLGATEGQPDSELDPSLPNIFRLAAANGYTTAAFGKWGVSGDHPQHPGLLGVDTSALTQENLESYYDYVYHVNSTAIGHTGKEYVTHFFGQRAINYVKSRAPKRQPFLLWFAPHAPHKPYHVPPQGSYVEPLAVGDNGMWKASMEALDTQIFNLWSAFTPLQRENTLWFVFSDNGTPPDVGYSPQNQGKGTTGEGGVKQTLMVWGKGVQAGPRPHLVQCTDFYATLQEIFGDFGISLMHSASFLSALGSSRSVRGREVLATEKFKPNTTQGPYTTEQYAARTRRWKIREDRVHGFQRFYDLSTAPPHEDGQQVDESAVPSAVVAQLRAALRP